MYLEQALWNIVSGALGGVIVVIIQNFPYIVRAKTKAEDKQKMDLKHIEEIINETEAVRRAVIQLDEEMLSLEHEIEGGEGTGNDIFSVKEITKKRLEKFIFLVGRNITIGGKDKILEKEKENLENICDEMFNVFEFEKPDPHAVFSGNMEDIDWEERYWNMALYFNRMKASKKVNACIKKIEKRYQKKLN